MIIFGNLTMSGGRIRGLQTAIFGDEPIAKADAGATGSKRVQLIAAASGTVVCDWSLYDEIRVVTVGAINVTFSGATDGQGCVLTIKGGNPVTLPASIRYNSLISLYVPTSGSTAIDKLGFSFDMGDNKYDTVSIVKGIHS